MGEPRASGLWAWLGFLRWIRVALLGWKCFQRSFHMLPLGWAGLGLSHVIVSGVEFRAHVPHLTSGLGEGAGLVVGFVVVCVLAQMPHLESGLSWT